MFWDPNKSDGKGVTTFAVVTVNVTKPASPSMTVTVAVKEVVNASVADSGAVVDSRDAELEADTASLELQ